MRVAVTDVPHARGVWRRSGAYATGWFAYGRPLRALAAPSDIDVSFAYLRRSRARVEADGFLYVNDGETAFLRDPDGSVVSAPSDRILLVEGPEKLLLAEIEPRIPRSRDSEPTVTEVELLGRRAWLAEAELGRFWVDDATGILLRREQGGRGDSTAEFVELDLKTPVTDAEVSFEGPATPLPLPAEQPRPEPGPRPRVIVPTLSWWPVGARPEVMHGDPATGRLLSILRLAWPDNVFLGRAPLTGPEPEAPGPVTYRWRTSSWRFVLSADERSGLTEAQLRQVADGIGA